MPAHLALREGPVRRHNEEHEVRSRDVLLRQPLLPFQDDVGAGRVDDVHVAQQLGWQAAHKHAVGLLTCAKDVARVLFESHRGEEEGRGIGDCVMWLGGVCVGER